MRVLVVEDDAAIGRFVAKGLSEAGYTVDLAPDGEEGLRRAVDTPAYDALVVDLMLRGERSIDLRPREFALLEYLARHPGRVVSKSMILSQIWNYSFDPRTNVVDVLVHRLRQKVDAPGEPPLIETRRGVGYVLRDA